jgi:phage terminase large subunit
MEIRIQLQHKQKQFLKTIEQVPVTFFGGARGGGKSHGLRSIMLYRRFQYPGSHGAIFRRTYGELEGNHIRPMLEAYPFLRKFYNQGKKILDLPNGSTLQFCHCKNDTDVSLYQGREFHDLAIDEAGQWTESMFRTLLGSNRSSKDGIKPRAILTGNPGSIGHKWLKRLFIERRFSERERPEDYAFIQSLVDDNPALIQNDPDYVHRLESEPNEALRRAFRFGDWDIFAGQFYSELSRDVHVVKPFAIPDHWTRFGAYDYGFNHPAAFGWFAVDEDGNVYLYREYVMSKQRVDQYAEHINKFADTKLLYPIVAGRDCWTTRNTLTKESPPTIADEFAKHNIYLKPANIERVQGAAQVRNYLAWQDLADGRTKPRFFIFDTCPITFDTLSRLQHDPNRPEDVLKMDAVDGDPTSGDDAADMARYALMSRPMLSDPPKRKVKFGSEEYTARIVERMKEEEDELEEAQMQKHKSESMKEWWER